MSHAEQIAKLLGFHPAKGAAVPVLFVGAAGIQHIGYASTSDGADCVLINAGVSAQRISRARLDGDTRHFYIAHR